MSTLELPQHTGPEDDGTGGTTGVLAASDSRAKHRGSGGANLPQSAVLLSALAFAVVAAILRLIHINASYNLFLDETTYARIARDSTLASGPVLFGTSFVLHPPVALLLLAAVAHALGTQDIAALVAGLRPFIAIIGSLTVAILFLTLQRTGLRRAAFLAAALVTLDPFVISYDSQVMLEAIAQLFAAVTVWAAIRSATAGPASRWRWAVVTAVAGSLTFGSKETFGLVIVATLALVAITTPSGERRPALVGLGGTLLGYGLISGAMMHWGGFGLWWQMRTSGLARLIGTKQSTGIKAPGVHGTLLERVLPNGEQFAGTYAILAIGGLCALSLLWEILRRRHSISDIAPVSLTGMRILAVWAICGCGYVAYAVAFGSLEEQMLYIAAAPCAATLAIRAFRLGRPLVQRVTVAIVSAIMLVQGSAWVQVHTVRDDVYAQMLSEINGVAPTGSTLDVTEETAQFVLSGYNLGQWGSQRQLMSNHVDYVLLSDKLVAQGYGVASAKFADLVRRHGTLALSVRGRDSDLELYDIRDWTHPTGANGDGS